MDNYGQENPKIRKQRRSSEDVSSMVEMSEQEQDIICRMHRLVGDRWALIAGRVPGRKPEEIERFWLMQNNENLKKVSKRSMEKKKRKVLI